MAESPERLPIEEPDPSIWCIQPAGGWAMRLELRRAKVRRWIVWKVCPSHAGHQRQKVTRQLRGLPKQFYSWDDLKFSVNQFVREKPKAICEYIRLARKNSFFVHWGTEEINLIVIVTFILWALFLATIVALELFMLHLELIDLPPVSNSSRLPPSLPSVLFIPIASLTFATAAIGISFFRDPPRIVPAKPNLILAPADGKVVEVIQLDHHPFIDGPAIRVGIFLSLFDVHVQRFPVDGRVIGVSWHPGKKLNALRPEAARENEAIETRIEEHAAPHRRIVMRQIAGMIASKVVNILRPGDEPEAGDRIGMIKFGSRCEIILPDVPELELHVALGMKLKAGESIVGRWVRDEGVEMSE